jgi:hypothetical protein
VETCISLLIRLEENMLFRSLKANTRRRNGSGSVKEKPLTDIKEPILNIPTTYLRSIVVIDDSPNVSEPGLNIGGDIINLVGDIEAERSDNEDVQTYY